MFECWQKHPSVKKHHVINEKSEIGNQKFLNIRDARKAYYVNIRTA